MSGLCNIIPGRPTSPYRHLYGWNTVAIPVSHVFAACPDDIVRGPHRTLLPRAERGASLLRYADTAKNYKSTSSLVRYILQWRRSGQLLSGLGTIQNIQGKVHVSYRQMDKKRFRGENKQKNCEGSSEDGRGRQTYRDRSYSTSRSNAAVQLIVRCCKMGVNGTVARA